MMDRPGHDYPPSASMAFAQQQQQAGSIQQQFGFHHQHQQFSPMPGRPFLPSHPSVQQHPFHHHVQHQAPPQLLPHSSVPHLMHPHLQQQAPPPPFFPPVPSHIVPPFMGSYDSGPPPVTPPPDPELHKRIDKLVEYSAKNGPEFEAMIREKQQENPAYSFLFGGEGYAYYRHKLWISTRATGTGGPFNPALSPSMPKMHHPSNPIMNSSMNVPFAIGPSAPMAGLSQMHQNSSPYFEPQPHQYSQPFGSHGQLEFDNSTKPFKGLSGPLPSDVAMELNDVLNNLTGTKESIKGAKIWFMQRSPFAPALAEALRDRFFTLDDSERQLHIIYLANDILFDSLQRRLSLHDLDNEALAFKPILGSMLARVYHNPQNRHENQSRLQKILQFWASKEVYDYDTIHALETEMIGGPPGNSYATHLERVSVDHSSISGMPNQTENHNNVAPRQMVMEAPLPIPVDQDNRDQLVPPGNVAAPIVTAPQCAPGSAPTSAFAGPVSIPSSAPQTQSQPHVQAGASGSGSGLDNVPPYPLFPPGLIPGMVRKMQIGSGVPYSPMSPLDIPTMIPPSSITPTEVSEKVSKFFKEIGEAGPSEQHVKASDLYDDYDREPPVRKGGACIPPPPNLQVDQEADGTQGSGGSGRLGLGASANPNDASQYDDVYTSYRKQRSTTYYSSLGVSLH